MAFRHTRSGPSAFRALGSARRHTAWFQFVPTLQVLTAAGGTIIFSLNAAALALRPFTVVRSRFSAFVASDQIAAKEQQVVGLGHAVVSDEAVAVGVSAVPTPISELGSDLWFTMDILMAGSDIGGGSGSQGNNGSFFALDSKAMRKVNVGQDIVSVAELSASGQGLRVIWGGRMLVKLH